MTSTPTASVILADYTCLLTCEIGLASPLAPSWHPAFLL